MKASILVKVTGTGGHFVNKRPKTRRYSEKSNVDHVVISLATIGLSMNIIELCRRVTQWSIGALEQVSLALCALAIIGLGPPCNPS